MAWAHCPECSAFLSEKRASHSSHVRCPGCGAKLVIVSVDPFDAVMRVASVDAPTIGTVDRIDGSGSERAPRRAP